MDDVKDRINQMIYRSQKAIDECRFCISLLDEQEKMSILFQDNRHTLIKLFDVNLRMAIIDIYTLVSHKDITSYLKMINILRLQKHYSNEISHMTELKEYLDEFEKEIDIFSDVIRDVLDFRSVLIAHTDGKLRRDHFNSRGIDVHKLIDLAFFLNVFSINLSIFVLDKYNNQLIANYFKNKGLSNTFEKISKYYKRN